MVLLDDTRPYYARITQEKFLYLGWSVLPHPPYSPDLASSDFHLFRSPQNVLNKNIRLKHLWKTS